MAMGVSLEDGLSSQGPKRGAPERVEVGPPVDRPVAHDQFRSHESRVPTSIPVEVGWMSCPGRVFTMPKSITLTKSSSVPRVVPNGQKSGITIRAELVLGISTVLLGIISA
jgi:hypothetical protein